jgi:putative alpha-1,2-mannosidase
MVCVSKKPRVSSNFHRFSSKLLTSADIGMAKAVADTNGDSNQGGFQMGETGGAVTGFSGMHDSGTGGLPSLGNFPIFPHAGCEDDDLNKCSLPKLARAQPYIPDSVKARPGYFGLTLQNHIVADMTAAQHTSLFRFTFPSDGSSSNSSPLIQLDLSDLSDSRQDNATISVDEGTGRMTGSARFLPSFAQGTYTAYFCADFNGGPVRDSGIYVNTRASNDVHGLTISRSINGYPLPGGGFVRFEAGTRSVLARVGVSMIGSEQACSNAEKEIPGFDFDGTKMAAEDIWREKLSRIEVDPEGVDDSLVTNFYSGIYRTMVNPQDYTGENPLWKSDEPYFDSFYW